MQKKLCHLEKLFFKVIDPKPKEELIFKNTKFDIVICIQTLIFLSDSDMKIAIENIYKNMNKGAILYVSMDAYIIIIERMPNMSKMGYGM